MKKFVLLSLLVCSAITYSSNAMDEPKLKETTNCLKRLALEESTPLESTLSYFNEQQDRFPELVYLAERSNFRLHAQACIEDCPDDNPRSIVASYIKICAQKIIRSSAYSHDNVELFQLVEALDPLYRAYGAKRQAVE